MLFVYKKNIFWKFWNYSIQKLAILSGFQYTMDNYVQDSFSNYFCIIVNLVSYSQVINNKVLKKMFEPKSEVSGQFRMCHD
jgi:hypothetical protein